MTLSFVFTLSILGIKQLSYRAYVSWLREMKTNKNPAQYWTIIYFQLPDVDLLALLRFKIVRVNIIMFTCGARNNGAYFYPLDPVEFRGVWR